MSRPVTACALTLRPSVNVQPDPSMQHRHRR
jgi:hypothetical protein